MDDFLLKMALNRKISPILLISVSITLILSIVFAIYWFFLRNQTEENSWQLEPTLAYIQAEQKNQPILLAFVDKTCGEEMENELNPCPAADSLSLLNNFALLEVLRNSDVFIEFQYDDRFDAQLEVLPKFYLLNSSGEIRDLRESFPDEKTLERWSKIR